MPINFSKNNTYTKKVQNTIAAALQQAKSDIILETVKLEVEVRQSDFIRLASKKGHLESSTVVIKFDRTSIVDLLMAGDLNQEAIFLI